MKLLIKKLYDASWQLFGFQFEAAVAERDHFQSEMKTNLGSETASQIKRHVDAAIGRIQTDVNPAIMTRREFYELLALEQTIEEIADRIDANAVFFDTDGLL